MKFIQYIKDSFEELNNHMTWISKEDAQKSTLRKLRNLSDKKMKNTHVKFAGVSSEIIFEGGEIKFLEKREKELVIAQEERIKESEKQMGWTEGIGKGDGIVASELNNVRGKKEAARKVFEKKGCTITD